MTCSWSKRSYRERSDELEAWISVELLYVVELEVRSAGADALPSVADARVRVLDHVAQWLSFGRTTTLSAEVFDEPGGTVLRSEHEGGADQRLAWTHVGAGETNALTITARSEITASGRADFICVVTVFSDGTTLTVRIELGREALGGVLAPAGIDFFRRPHLLVLLLRDRDLACWAGPSKVDGRFNWVNPPHAETVWDALNADGRLLPVLLVDGSSVAGEQLAKRVASELAGLAPVLAVDQGAQRLLADRLEAIDAIVPRDGARLVWPDLALRHPAFTSDQARAAPSRLFRMLSAISVTVRGVNGLIREATIAQRIAQNKQVADDLAAAKAEGNLTDEIEAQARVIERLTSHIEEYDTWFKQVEEERDSYRAQAAQAAYWKQEAERARQSAMLRAPDWSAAPHIDANDLDGLADFLQAQSQGAIVFTPDARRSWRKDAYHRIDVMRESLITLAQAAVEYRGMGCQLGMHPDEWFKHEWELTIASTDQYMAKNGLADFTFEGRTLSRLPHVKLGDHTSPNEVGRIYFAMDSDKERFVVDHVGLKLYGL